MSGEARDVWAAGLAPDRVLEVDPGALSGSLPHRDDAFDAIICAEPVEQLPDPEALVAELARVLAPGGVLVISLPPDGALADAVRARFPERRPLARLAAIQAERVELRERLVEAEEQASLVLKLEADLEEARRRRDDVERSLETSNRILDDVIASPSWRLTKPVRALKDRFGGRDA